MIQNPSNITTLLRAWSDLAIPDAAHLAHLLTIHIGPQPWPVFQNTYRLYLQSIPIAIAREAWGLTQTKNQPATKS